MPNQYIYKYVFYTVYDTYDKFNDFTYVNVSKHCFKLLLAYKFKIRCFLFLMQKT